MAQREQFLQDRAVIEPVGMRPLIRGPGVERDEVRFRKLRSLAFFIRYSYVLRSSVSSQPVFRPDAR